MPLKGLRSIIRKCSEIAYGMLFVNKLGLEEGITSWDLKNRIPRQKLHIIYLQILRTVGLNLVNTSKSMFISNSGVDLTNFVHVHEVLEVSGSSGIDTNKGFSKDRENDRSDHGYLFVVLPYESSCLSVHPSPFVQPRKGK